MKQGHGLRIDYEYTMSAADAARYVAQVIDAGRMSEAAGIPHYCWVTTFRDGTVVSTSRKKTANSADSFIVYRRTK